MIHKHRPVCFFVLFMVLLNFSGFGQPKADSLLLLLEHTTDRIEKIKLNLSLSYETEDSRESLIYAKSAQNLLQDEDDSLLKEKVNLHLGRSYANSNILDSANLCLKQSIERFKVLNEPLLLSRALYFQAFVFELSHSFDSAKLNYYQAIALADSVGDRSKSALYRLYLGELLNTSGDNAEALINLKKAHEYYSEPERADSAWISFNSLAIVYDEMGLYPEALDYYLKAYEISEQNDDKYAKLILANNLGTIYYEIGKIEEAKAYFAQSMEMARATDQRSDEAMILNNLSSIYTEEGDTLTALNLIRKAHAIQKTEESNCDLAYSYEGLGEVMSWQEKYDSAQFYFDQAMNWAETCNLTGCQTSIYRNMGLLALKQKKNARGVALLNKSLELGERSSYISEMQETANELYNYYRRVNDYRNALKYNLLQTELKDSLFNAQSTEKIARLTAEFDFRREIESLEYKKMADEMRLNEELRQKESYQNSMMVVLVLTLLLAATLGRSYYLVQNHNKKLTALNEEKNTLMGVVAHDLRSPLNNIKGLISLVKMEKSGLSPEQSHYFHLVDDTMERMRDMIDRVLDVSVVEDMKVKLNLKKVDLGETMNFVAGNFEMLAGKKSIKIHSNLDTEKHFVFADYNYLLQVIENLLSNAIKFSEQGKNIFMNVFQEDDIETMIIRDEGPGISEEDQKRLFTKFQKLSAKPTDNEQSTGLGLSIVKKFVDAMDAEIRCESQVGKGTSFIVRFNTAVEQELV